MANEYDIIFIGSGPAGYVGSIKAAQEGMKVACVEKDNSTGGTCLNVGCIPSKALLHASELVWELKSQGASWGIEYSDLKVNMEQMAKRKEEIVKKLTGGIQYLFKKNKVDHIRGKASFKDQNTLEIEGKEYTAKNIVIATGSEPIALPFLPFDEKRVLSSTGALALKEIPKKLIVVGGGVIGLELGSVYRRLGSEVEVIEFMDHIVPEFDQDVSKTFQKMLEKDGITFNLSSKVTSAHVSENAVELTAETPDGEKQFSADYVLVCIGRKPFTKDLRLEKAEIATDEKGFIKIDANFRTSKPHIFAVGDVACPPMLAHKGSEEAVAAVEIIAGREPRLNYSAVPNVIYTYPEVATVGFTEDELKKRDLPYKSASFPTMANSRCAAVGEDYPGFVKFLAHPETLKLYGAAIISPNAGDLIMEPTLAITHGLTVKDIAHTIHPHPTFSESLHEAALGILSKFIHY